MEHKKCSHLNQVKNDIKPNTEGCEECLKTGSMWVELRLCLVCGHVGCCDSSPNKHATKHFKDTGHAIMRSMLPGKNWKWCYVDEIVIEE